MTTGMRRAEVARGPGGRVLTLDTITALTADDAGCVVVSGSHGGVSSGAFAMQVPLKLAIFNDAGVGKGQAGIAALAMLQAQGRAGGAVSHDSACIGDAQDCWLHGVLSHLNAAALALGLRPGDRLRQVLPGLIGARGEVVPPTGIEPVSGA
jgi:hypothetical protein